MYNTHLMKHSLRKCVACSEQCGGSSGFVSSVTILNMAAVGSNSYQGGWHFNISTTVAPTLLLIYKNTKYSFNEYRLTGYVYTPTPNQLRTIEGLLSIIEYLYGSCKLSSAVLQTNYKSSNYRCTIKI